MSLLNVQAHISSHFRCLPRYPEAIELLLQVVQACPTYPDPYHTLGLLHEAVGNPRKVGLCIQVADAHPKSLNLGHMARNLLTCFLGLWKVDDCD